MLIGEVVQRAGVSRDTIRYYEKFGLLQAEGRPSPFNNYKSYPASTVTRLGLIQQAKELGFSLAEIAEVLALWDSAQLSDTVIQARIAAKVAAIDEKISLLQRMRAELLRSLNDTQAGRCA